MVSDTDLPHQPDTTQQIQRSFTSLMWKVSFILLFFVDIVLIYYLFFLIRVYDYDFLTKTTFIFLPIINLFILIVYDMLITHGDSIALLKFGFVLLIIDNLMFGYNIYDHMRYSIGVAFIPLIYVFAINDLISVLFYIRTQHPQRIERVIFYAILTLISLFIVLPFIYMWFFRF
jgi:hypothetical protein